MNTKAIKKMTIIDSLSQVPESHLDEIQRYINSLLIDIELPQQENKSLAGIWKDAGFEKIVDLEGEIRSARQALQSKILQRKI